MIRINGLRKTYGEAKHVDANLDMVYDGFDLTVADGDFVTIFGPNGCGKSTLLHILAGLVPFDDGTILVDGHAPGSGRIGFVFQSFQATLLPWKRNLDNVAWPLELQGVSREVRRERARRILKAANATISEDGYPYNLSGGQQQLLCIARALITEPSVLFMDEPFNQLDYQTRLDMQLKTLELCSGMKTTVLFVSHDLDEALLLGDKTILLSRRPTRVLEVIENHNPRSRDHELLKSADFFAVRSHALAVFTNSLHQ